MSNDKEKRNQIKELLYLIHMLLSIVSPISVPILRGKFPTKL